MTVLASLPQAANPLLQATDGNFYGTIPLGGDRNFGTFFKLTPKGVVTTIFDFDHNTFGSQPSGNLALGRDGNFYGTAYYGGSQGRGTVYKLTPQGTITLLHTFNSIPNDGMFGEGLVQATDGNFYGVTPYGGSANLGVIYQITPAGDYSILHNFDGSDGANPDAPPMQATDGKLYGLTEIGGATHRGVAYSLDMGLEPFVSFVSAAGKVGATVQILGQGFTGTTSVSFNGTAANFKVISDTFLGAVVPDSTTTGYVTVTTASGTLTSNVPFHVIP